MFCMYMCVVLDLYRYYQHFVQQYTLSHQNLVTSYSFPSYHHNQPQLRINIELLIISP